MNIPEHVTQINYQLSLTTAAASPNWSVNIPPRVNTMLDGGVGWTYAAMTFINAIATLSQLFLKLVRLKIQNTDQRIK